MNPKAEHDWPTDQTQHCWSKWRQKTRAGTKDPIIQTRSCIDPECGAYEERQAPK